MAELLQKDKKGVHLEALLGLRDERPRSVRRHPAADDAYT